jgi:hypothetical protein
MFDDIIKNSKWSESHGAIGNHAGMGMFYFSLPYSLRASSIVCLGSGAGFVPKLTVEAQRHLIKEGLLSQYNVSLIDANIGPWGLPVYSEGIYGYPEINLIVDKTDNCHHLFESIDYLHVDADHSYEQIYKDLSNYGTKMNQHKVWAITVHDTNNPSDGDHPPIGSYHAAVDWARENNHDMVNFAVGCGTAIIMPKVGR